MRVHKKVLPALLGALFAGSLASAQAAGPIQTVDKLWAFNHFAANAGRSSEIVAFDSANQNLWVIGGNGIDVLSLEGSLLKSFETTSLYGAVNSISIRNGIAAVAFNNPTARDGVGTVQFFDTTTFVSAATVGAANLGGVTVGNVPDMLTWTADGSKVLVANEGERYVASGTTFNPAGSVSVIDFNAAAPGTSAVTTVGFTAFDGQESALRAAGVRIQAGLAASIALEPEYIAISPDGNTAHVTLQEANAVGIFDLNTRTFTDIVGLGLKDYSLPGNQIDPSNQDGGVSFRNVPVKSLYQPDGIAAYSAGGNTYYVMANEGDAYTDDSDIRRLGDPTIPVVLLDPAVFPNAADLKLSANLGALNISVLGADGLGPGPGGFTEIVSIGGRSFSIRDTNGAIVYDSGDILDKQAHALGLYADSRSDDKGVEPEGVALFTVAGRTLAFIGLERTSRSVVAVFDITDPANSTFLQMIAAEAGSGEVRPEGLLAFAAAGKIYLAVANEAVDEIPSANGSNRTVLYEITPVPEPSTYALMGLGLAGLAWVARRKRG
ncbi:MAG: choice-of-anchor I family protein [Burkholderiales bacterium]|nr:choice-of-anchor I family protein [Burkholderiales bacterium]